MNEGKRTAKGSVNDGEKRERDRILITEGETDKKPACYSTMYEGGKSKDTAFGEKKRDLGRFIVGRGVESDTAAEAFDISSKALRFFRFEGVSR